MRGSAGAPVNAVDLGGNTPLCAAVVAGNLSIVKFLLSCRDAQPDLARADGQTARSLATTSSDPRLLALFRGIPVRFRHFCDVACVTLTSIVLWAFGPGPSSTERFVLHRCVLACVIPVHRCLAVK